MTKQRIKIILVLLILITTFSCSSSSDSSSTETDTSTSTEESDSTASETTDTEAVIETDSVTGIGFATVPTDGVTPEFQMATAEISNEIFNNFLNEAFAQDKITYDTVTKKVYNLDGKEVIFLGGSRVVKDHDNDGDYVVEEMENPLNICFIQFNEDLQLFEVKDPAAIDWDQYFNPGLFPNVVDSIDDWYELSGNQDGFCGEGDTDGKMPTLDEVKSWPANFVRWYGAELFAEFYDFDLPTLSQWKLAGKGGQDFEYTTSDGTAAEGIAWINIDGPGWPPHKGHVQPVKSKSPNPLGVYNLGGNVWEWTKNWYRGTEVFSMNKIEEDFYIAESPEDPKHLKGLFGGSFNYFPATMGVAWNHAAMPNTANDHFGFRVIK